MSEICEYKKRGFYIKRNLLTVNTCKDIISQLNEIKTDMKIPHTNIQFGYGNIINTELASIITDNMFIKKFCNKLYGQNYYYNSLYVHNKHRWVGPDVEWHQEVFNIKTFHPTNNNYTLDEIKNNFMQVYVALEDQNIENGGMRIIPYHKTILEHYDTTNTHLNHKRAITPEELDKIYKTHDIINLDLKAGDVMFFNHLIPHSSSSNNSPIDRKAMVFLTYKNNEDFDENIRTIEKEYRKSFALKYLQKTLDDKLNTQMYECGKKSKKIKKEKTWSSIFEKLPWFEEDIYNIENYSLTTLLKLNGHLTSDTGKYDIKNWEETISHFKQNIKYNDKNNYKILEVGCGAGALLKMFEKQEIYGIDPSKKYINIIKKALPQGVFINGDALCMDKYDNDFFDIIFCHSCIQYFKDYKYFNDFITLCHKKLKPCGKLCLTDLPNLDMKEKYINHRKNVIGEKKYKEKYQNINLYHFYISKSQIVDSLSNNFNNIKFTNAIKRGIEDNFYRINLFCEKNE
uniref:Methyltransferase type 11 domain-containing protein n=1 Tax=viral metagenome TaxID=1070528 RepID=A0A6C0JA09_9ZZZZ